MKIMTKYNYLDLFSGIGGFHLGLERAGFEFDQCFFSEIDSYAISVYQNNFKNSQYVGSVTDVRGAELPKIDIITFGSPCQDFSLAGARGGLHGERSSLIGEAIRLIKELKPSIFIWENVKGTFSTNNRADFAAILQEFANIGGYRLGWQLLNTKWFLPQNRERIYLVGCLGDRSTGEIFPIREGDGKDDSQIKVVGDTNKGGQRGAIYDPEGIMTTLSATDYKQPKQIKFKSNNSKGYEEASIGDAVRLDHPGSKTSRGRVGKSTSPTVDTTGNQGVLVSGTWRTHKDGRGFREIKDGNAPTIPARAREDGSGQPVIKYKYGSKNLNELLEKENLSEDDVKALDIYNKRAREDSPTLLEPHHNSLRLYERGAVRRLTPIECERLQGFPDDWTKQGIENEVISDTQRYKMCGNAVTVNVVEAVGINILKSML
jgi:DNA (cytosine-5)-methyltransferase 1